MTQRYRSPDQLHYERTQHMWARPDEDDSVVVGIDVLGLENLGDLAYLTLFI
ncbi:MAG: glycine cleavage system H lipoate-binding protein [Kiritimatiellia bacterium]